MKKAISFLSLLLMAIIAFAEPHFVSLSNKGGKTTVIFTSNPQLSSSASFLRLNVLSSLN